MAAPGWCFKESPNPWVFSAFFPQSILWQSQRRLQEVSSSAMPLIWKYEAVIPVTTRTSLKPVQSYPVPLMGLLSIYIMFLMSLSLLHYFTSFIVFLHFDTKWSFALKDTEHMFLWRLWQSHLQTQFALWVAMPPPEISLVRRTRGEKMQKMSLVNFYCNEFTYIVMKGKRLIHSS